MTRSAEKHGRYPFEYVPAADGQMGLLLHELKKAERAVQEALSKRFPTGTTIHFYIMHGQVHPSKGVVLDHPGGRYGYLLVRLESRTRQTRNVPYTDVIRG